jgi:hypothetical protein
LAHQISVPPSVSCANGAGDNRALVEGERPASRTVDRVGVAPKSGDDNPEAITLGLHDALPAHLVDAMPDNVVLDLGWGRLVFGQTFSDPDHLAEVLRREEPGRRDICMYASEAHVVVAGSPHELFIDPSHTYRLRFSGEPLAWSPTGITVRLLESPQDAEEMNRV